jgi:hypothetical protein
MNPSPNEEQNAGVRLMFPSLHTAFEEGVKAGLVPWQLVLVLAMRLAVLCGVLAVLV